MPVGERKEEKSRIMSIGRSDLQLDDDDDMFCLVWYLFLAEYSCWTSRKAVSQSIIEAGGL